MGVLEPQLAQMILADVLDVPGRGIEAQPPVAVDVGDAQWPAGVEHVGCGSGTGIIVLARPVLTRLFSLLSLLPFSVPVMLSSFHLSRLLAAAEQAIPYCQSVNGTAFISAYRSNALRPGR